MKAFQKISILGITAGVLFVISFGLYLYQHRLITPSITGRDFIQGLDVSRVDKIEIRDQEKEIVLSKNGKSFLLSKHSEYPADTEKVNDLLYKLASIKLDSEITDGDSKSFDLGDKEFKYEISLVDERGRPITAFRVGKSVKQKGHYLRFLKENKIYLSESPIHFSVEPKNYVIKKLLTLNSEVESLELTKKSQSLSFQTQEGEDKQKAWIAAGIPPKKLEISSIESYLTSLKGLELIQFYLSDADEVQDLDLEAKIEVATENNLSYQLELLKKEDKYFVRMGVNPLQMPATVEISQSDSSEELKKVEGLLVVQDLAKKFNLKHSGWIYEIPAHQAEALLKERKDFLKSSS